MFAMQKKISGLFICLLFALLSGCATYYPKTATSGNHMLTWKNREYQLNEFNTWKASGSFGVTVDGKTNIASFDWQQNNKKYLINIFTALHVGSAKIIGNDTSVTLWKSEKTAITAKNPEDLLYHEFGWTLPIANLIYWVKGVPAPGFFAAKMHFDAFLHLISFEQQNWQIQYRDFVSVDDIDVPTKIYLENPKLKIKIVIKHWDR